jgi:hypothetical protein
MRTYFYILLFIPTVILAALIWDGIAVDKLFYCSDSCGPIDFIPPFVHSVGGDHYIAPAPIVWLLWFGLVALTLAVPAVAILGGFALYNRLMDKLESK